MVQFPTAIDVLLPLLDGFSPITQADQQTFEDAIRRIEEVLGAGESAPGGNYGPRGGNATVAARLNRFLEPDGGLRGIVFATGSAHLDTISEDHAHGGGLTIPFNKTLQRGNTIGLDGYGMIWACTSPGTENDIWLAAAPACAWASVRGENFVTMKARDMSGTKITVADQRAFDWAALIVGWEAFYP